VISWDDWAVNDDEIAPADPAPASRVWPLEGTTWVLTEIRNADGAHAVPGGIRSTFQILDGHAHVETGCNTGHASVSISDDTIQIGPMALTRMMCPDSVMWVEREITAALSGAVPYLHSVDVLALGRAELVLVYRSDLPSAA